MSYQIVRKAIVDRQSLTAIYDDYVRHFSPYSLGKNATDVQCLVVYQYGGGKRGGLSVRGEWSCFNVAGLRALRLNGDKWVSGTIVGRPIHCISKIDVSAEGLT